MSGHEFHVHEKSSRYLTASEIKARQPFAGSGQDFTSGALARARQRMEVAGVWSPNQILGRGYPIGCVALEVTQRCNLDCTLCYLSTSSESTKDIPLEEIYRRIQSIHDHYGPKTDIQITGGDPSLRHRPELMGIVKRIHDLGMRPAIMTNGIAVTRDLLEELVDNHLHDVAYHVDLTQERKGFSSEAELNEIRSEYIERARGLPLHVIFNTTIFDGNVHETAELVKFFKRNTDVVGMVSFQLQAETGRSRLGVRDSKIDMDTVQARIEEGAGTKISFDVARIGHPRCHRYGLTMEANGVLHDFFDDKGLFNALMEESSKLRFERGRVLVSLVRVVKWGLSTKNVVWPGLRFLFRKLWQMKGNLLKSGFRVRKLSFFMQNFMDASRLEVDRINACSFMVMTAKGPISMCLHNAKRDEYILEPVRVGKELWNPLTGRVEETL